MAIRWEAKRPSEVRDYRIDWSDFLGDDTIASHALTATGATIDLSEIDDGGQGITAWLSGGTAGTIARLTNTIITAGGRTERETFTLPISDCGEPVSLADAKAHCGIIDDTSKDGLLAGYIKAAREWVENYTGHILVRREIVEQRDCFGPYLDLHRRPIVSATIELSYVDTDGAAQGYANFVAFTDRFPARVFPERSGAWPIVGSPGGVTITYTAGYAEGEEPQPLLQGIMLLVEHWHTHRGPMAMGIVNEAPFAVTALCGQYRTPGL